jgi:hypothetical protein
LAGKTEARAVRFPAALAESLVLGLATDWAGPDLGNPRGGAHCRGAHVTSEYRAS